MTHSPESTTSPRENFVLAPLLTGAGALIDLLGFHFLSDRLFEWLIATFSRDSTIQLGARICYQESLRERGRSDDALQVVTDGLLWLESEGVQRSSLAPRLGVPVGLFHLLDQYAELLGEADIDIPLGVVSLLDQVSTMFEHDAKHVTSGSIADLVESLMPVIDRYLEIVSLMARTGANNRDVQRAIDAFLNQHPEDVFQEDFEALKRSNGKPFLRDR